MGMCQSRGLRPLSHQQNGIPRAQDIGAVCPVTAKPCAEKLPWVSTSTGGLMYLAQKGRQKKKVQLGKRAFGWFHSNKHSAPFFGDKLFEV